jgi:hypothetical protein
MPLSTLAKTLPVCVQTNLVYVVDAELNVVNVNKKWRDFATENNGEKLLGEGWNRNLLANFSGSEKVRWTAIYEALLDGRLSRHTEQFQCPSPLERRSFVMVIDRQLDAAGAVEYLLHYTVRLSPSDHDDEGIEESYRDEVINRAHKPGKLNAAVHFEPLETAGGDFTWERSYPDHVDVVIGDFVGHGKSAAAHALHAVRWLDAATSADDSVTQTVQSLNEACYDWAERVDELVFATGLFMRCYFQEHRMEICSFGHASPIFSAAGELVMDGGMPVGLIRSESHWPVHRLDMATHGQRFLSYSDGISEQFNELGEMFGSERLVDVFRGSLDGSVDDQRDRLMEALEAFRGEAIIKDDRTIMVILFAPTQSDRPAKSLSQPGTGLGKAAWANRAS